MIIKHLLKILTYYKVNFLPTDLWRQKSEISHDLWFLQFSGEIALEGPVSQSTCKSVLVFPLYQITASMFTILNGSLSPLLPTAIQRTGKLLVSDQETFPFHKPEKCAKLPFLTISRHQHLLTSQTKCSYRRRENAEQWIMISIQIMTLFSLNLFIITLRNICKSYCIFCKYTKKPSKWANTF